jgi:hypothetical protein
MRGLSRGGAGSGVIRPLARAADGIVHNRERRRMIRRYRCAARVTLAPGRGERAWR